MKTSAIYSLIVHSVFFVLIGLQLSKSETVIQVQATQPEIIHSMAISEQDIEAEVSRIAAFENAEAEAKAAELKALSDKAAKLKKQASKSQSALNKLASEIKESEKEKALALKQKAALAEKLKAEKAENAKKLAAEKDKLKTEKAALAKATEAARAAREKAILQESRHLMEQALFTEQQRLAAQDEVTQFYQVIVGRIQSNWRRDFFQGQNYSCKIHVKVSGTGDVTDAKVVKSSGNDDFDRQAALAVLRSSPLPLPASQQARQVFMSGFDFLFKPES